MAVAEPAREMLDNLILRSPVGFGADDSRTCGAAVGPFDTGFEGRPCSVLLPFTLPFDGSSAGLGVLPGVVNANLTFFVFGGASTGTVCVGSPISIKSSSSASTASDWRFFLLGLVVGAFGTCWCMAALLSASRSMTVLVRRLPFGGTAGGRTTGGGGGGAILSFKVGAPASSLMSGGAGFFDFLSSKVCSAADHTVEITEIQQNLDRSPT